METRHKHHHAAEIDLQLNMRFRTDPITIKAGRPVKLYFKPELAGQPDAIVPLTFLHEKKIHLIIMSKDLSYFSHKHPELSGNGEYVWEHKFLSGGDYILFQDYLPEGAAQQLGRQEIHIAGEEVANGRTESVATTWKGGEYEVSISFKEQGLKVNAAVMFKAVVTKNGRAITDLENYLGSLAHVVIISSDTENYLHVHPMESATHGPEIMLHTLFPRNGYYKIFMEFKHEGQIRLATFVVEVGANKIM